MAKRTGQLADSETAIPWETPVVASVPASLAEIGVLGRYEELAFLSTLISSARDGQGGSVLLVGEAGIGKTVLLREFAERARDARMRVTVGKGDPLTTPIPFGVLAATLGAVPGVTEPEVAGLGAAISGAGVTGGRETNEQRVAELAVSLVEKWCAEGPTAIVVDDIQWCDHATMLVLCELVRLSTELPLVVLTGARPSRGLPGVDRYQSELALAGHVRRIGPLDDDSIGRLVDVLVGGTAGPSIEPIVRGVAGNPLFLIEAVTALIQEGRIERAAGVAVLTRPELPRSLVDVVVRRLRFLRPRTFHICRLAAVLGSRFAVRELALLAGERPTDLVEPIVEASVAGLLVDSGGALTFRHDLSREALADDLPKPVRAAIHLQAAKAFQAEGLPVERVAAHLLEVGDEHDPWVLDWLAREADELIRRAPAVAVELIGRALAGSSHDQPVAHRLHAANASALLWCGRVDEAIEAARLVLRLRVDDLAVRRTLLLGLAAKGDLPGALAEVERIVETPDTPAAAVLWARGYAVTQRAAIGDPGEAVTAARTVIADAEHAGDLVAQSHAMFGAALALFKLDDMVGALANLDAALARAALTDVDHAHLANLHALRATTLLQHGDITEAHAAMNRARPFAERAGGMLLSWAYHSSTMIRFYTGDWDDALAEAEAGSQVGGPPGYALGMLGVSAQIALHRGDTAAADALFADLRGQAASAGMGEYYDNSTATAHALRLAAGGETPAAIDALTNRRQTWQEPVTRRVWRLSTAIRLAVRAGLTDTVVALRESLHGETAASTSPVTSALTRWSDGLADDEPEAVADAAARLATLGYLPAAATCAQDLAVIHARHGDLRRARTSLAEATAGYVRLDAAWDIARAGQELRRWVCASVPEATGSGRERGGKA